MWICLQGPTQDLFTTSPLKQMFIWDPKHPRASSIYLGQPTSHGALCPLSTLAPQPSLVLISEEKDKLVKAAALA